MTFFVRNEHQVQFSIKFEKMHVVSWRTLNCSFSSRMLFGYISKIGKIFAVEIIIVPQSLLLLFGISKDPKCSRIHTLTWELFECKNCSKTNLFEFFSVSNGIFSRWIFSHLIENQSLDLMWFEETCAYYIHGAGQILVKSAPCTEWVNTIIS